MVEQRFCKPLVASSNLAPGSRLVGGLDEGVDVLLKKFLGRWRSGQSHLTVNQATSVYGGSNPSLPTGEWRTRYIARERQDSSVGRARPW